MSRILEHETRRTMLEALQGSPGLTVGEMASAMGVHYKTALHHALRLARAGHLVVARDGRRAHCYLPGDRRARGPQGRALEALHAVACGARGPADLARALGAPHGTAGSLLRRLDRAGLVARSGDGWVVARPEAFTGVGPLGVPWSAASSAR